ncbi:hypothetical protein SCP_0103400 [Sparassis crispa]|uniref:Galactose oxidase n=1 Tax=Sparassis crispa TaxID=139825 RepID=A0A401G5L7_9APHY|nr:hypothetical protein SCP_0103400 [Sparassis crispa]GBE77465.1 hypothetical protein SCP_0103400 [Sparassis crispa]
MPVARWSLLSKTPWIARSSHSVSVTKSGVVVVYGGELKPRTPVDSCTDGQEGIVKGSVHLFDLKDRSSQIAHRGWRTLSPASNAAKDATSGIPDARVGATIVCDGQSLYLWGGRGGVDMAPPDKAQVGIWRSEIKDDETSTVINWQRIPAVNEEQAPESRSFHTAVTYAGKIYIHAGCPTTGRLSALDSFDIATRTWKSLAPAPDPVRGGTSLAMASPNQGGVVLVRYGGFSGYELPSEAGSLDVYSIEEDKWFTVQPKADSEHGSPGSRSVHGFAPFQSTSPSLVDAVALLFHGERDASTLGHAGAGTFWHDVWLLTKQKADGVTDGWAWKKAEVTATNATSESILSVPEGRGWLGSTAWVDDKGNSRIVMHGGLLSSNERSDELWELQVE